MGQHGACDAGVENNGEATGISVSASGEIPAVVRGGLTKLAADFKVVRFWACDGGVGLGAAEASVVAFVVLDTCPPLRYLVDAWQHGIHS